jgi:hypothetical protein
MEKKGGKKGRLLLGLIIQAEKNDFNMKNQSKKRLWLHDQCVLHPPPPTPLKMRVFRVNHFNKLKVREGISTIY